MVSLPGRVFQRLQSQTAMNWPSDESDWWLIQSQCQAGLSEVHAGDLPGARPTCPTTVNSPTLMTMGAAGMAGTSWAMGAFGEGSEACATGSQGRRASQASAAPPIRQGISPAHAVRLFIRHLQRRCPAPLRGPGWRCVPGRSADVGCVVLDHHLGLLGLGRLGEV
ncbi:MAG: hypothetical protein ACRD6W_11610, partial [Nitrososphaerales archaeon]